MGESRRSDVMPIPEHPPKEIWKPLRNVRGHEEGASDSSVEEDVENPRERLLDSSVGLFAEMIVLFHVTESKNRRQPVDQVVPRKLGAYPLPCRVAEFPATSGILEKVQDAPRDVLRRPNAMDALDAIPNDLRYPAHRGAEDGLPQGHCLEDREGEFVLV